MTELSNSEILERLDPGSNVQEIASGGGCRVFRLSDPTGDGYMTIYDILPGIMLMYNDFHLEQCRSDFITDENLLCIDHCRKGRIECRSSSGHLYYMSDGDFRLDNRMDHRGVIHMPLRHFHGLTIGLHISTAQRTLAESMPLFSVSLPALAEKYCSRHNLILHDEERTGRIFAELYHLPQSREQDLIRLKIMELLLSLQMLRIDEAAADRPYYPAALAEKVKEIHAFLTEDLSREHTLESLAKQFAIPQTSMRRCFEGIYGSPIHRYLKNCRMRRAAELLRSAPDMKIAEIAAEVGYHNPARFSAAFREITGLTPNAYRSTDKEKL